MEFLKAAGRKFSSRKLWMAIAGAITGVAIALGANNTDISTVAFSVKTVIGAITALASIITYIRAEGKIDAESVKNASTDVQTIINEINNIIDKIKGENNSNNDSTNNMVADSKEENSL